MSTVDPDGTWQYAHSVCCPSGARWGSNSDDWATSTNGAAGCSPLATAASAAATSASVPPTCTVPAPATAGSDHGTGSDRA